MRPFGKIIAMFVCAQLCVLASTALSQGGTQPLPGSLSWWASNAKARGQTKIETGPIQGHDYTPKLSQTIANSYMVQGTVVTAKLDHSDGFHIYQWYRVTPTKHSSPQAREKTTLSKQLPAGLSISDGTLLIRIAGGTADIDGVQITESGPPPLSEGHSYLFFLDKTDAGFYELAFNTRAIPLKSTGEIDHDISCPTVFCKQLSSIRTFDDVQNLKAK
jgi:hypothetical protein